MPGSPSVAAVSFDLDDTLIRYDHDPDEVLDEAFRRAGVGPFCTPDELWAVASETPDADSDHQFLTYLFRAAADRYGGPTESAATLARTYEAATDHTAVSFRPGAEAALAAAREVGPVGLITNGGRDVQEVKLRELGLTGAFDSVVFAGEETRPKPAREPFERALTELSADPTETLYVGNSLHHDVAGAKRAGWHAAWYPRESDRDESPEEHAPDYTFETLSELEEAF
ncbi:HAD family hydrolase [Halosegnis marinus]|uniref:HAD family hydrolase n=1 Tax=Halosegnis marinus TaxID=3034023 RepID=A0ABD5ZQV1_9EURY|nr:HAD family hydrolase [Halosegnis sp. DT85]